LSSWNDSGDSQWQYPEAGVDTAGQLISGAGTLHSFIHDKIHLAKSRRWRGLTLGSPASAVRVSVEPSRNKPAVLMVKTL
jgi:hypothetical protein